MRTQGLLAAFDLADTDQPTIEQALELVELKDRADARLGRKGAPTAEARTSAPTIRIKFHSWIPSLTYQ